MEAVSARLGWVMEEGKDVTLAGCCILTFDDDGLVVGSREYWFMEDGGTTLLRSGAGAG